VSAFKRSEGGWLAPGGRGRCAASLVALCLALGLLASGCGSDDNGDSTASTSGGSDTSAAAKGKPEQTSVKIGYSAIDIPLLPEKIAVDKGIFKKNGVDVDFISFDGDTKAAQALQSGAVDMLSAGGPVALSSGRVGDPAVMVALLLSRPTDMLVSTKDVKSGADLKGKKIAVSQLGGDSQASVMLALKVLGVDAKDVTIVQVGGQSDRIAALTSGSVAAAPIDEANEADMKKQGFNILAKLSDSSLRTPRHGLMAPQSYLDHNPATMRALVKSILEGAVAMNKDKDMAAQEWADWSEQDLKDAEVQLPVGLANIQDQACLMTKPEWWDTLQEIMSGVDPSLGDVDVSKVWTNDVVDGLVKDGTAAKLGASC
jgi:NitT/TauT family transport system substrate-binding protein